ncbi:hypothetical protein JTB14_002765 [Gonioctena quinquepunctata]|nr:hypothetical protein JTB14_002765 [Gonioctena quinquepunctata]
MSEDIIQRIVNESHIYAQQRGVTFDTTIEEMKVFFGFLIIKGFYNLPSIRLYWSTDQNMRVSRIANTISLMRFLTIVRYLHINNNENAPKKGDPNFDKLYKLKPMVTHLNQKFKEIFFRLVNSPSMKAWWTSKDVAVHAYEAHQAWIQNLGNGLR